jgi:septation ring formation regulator EzrA
MIYIIIPIFVFLSLTVGYMLCLFNFRQKIKGRIEELEKTRYTCKFSVISELEKLL